jgi:hypothetical protein
VPITLDTEEIGMLEALRELGVYGSTNEEVLRHVFFSWWIEQFMQGPKHFRGS